MLEFLVTSKARRRMLLLLWQERATGSVAELADAAGVGVASAYRELRAMERLGLVTTERRERDLAYSANWQHPRAAALQLLVTPASPLPVSAAAKQTRAELAGLGAPVVVDRPRAPRAEVEALLIEGVVLAHRDPALARSLPVAFFRQRDRLDPKRLASLARSRAEKAAVGLFLELTAEVSGERRFAEWAKPLRDRRVHQQRPFFFTEGGALLEKHTSGRSPSLARHWGYRLDLSLEDFQTLFDKAGRATP